MNSLSWMIYLAGVLENIGLLLTLTAVFGGAVTLTIFVGRLFGGWDEEELPWLQRAGRKGMVVAVACAAMATFMPSKRTMYAMAASEVGEKLAQTEVVSEISREALDTLKHWLHEQWDEKKK